MNALGIDVGSLDTDAFLGTARRLFPLLAVLWIVAGLRIRRAEWLLTGVVLANAWVWFVTVYPLQRIYGLGISQDRLLGLGLVQVTAAGQSPLYGVQVGQLHFEPFWSAFTAVVSGWDPDRLLLLYPFLPLLMAAGFGLSLYFGLRPLSDGGHWSPWERVAVAGFATLLSSAPLEFDGTYRVPWALTFLLKPNHALGLVILPWLLRSVARIRGWRDRMLAGLVLQLLGWAFVLHMVYAAAGLLLFALTSWLQRRQDARKDALDVGASIGVNLLLVSPYLAMLVIDYPFMVPSPAMTVPNPVLHVVEGTLFHGPTLLLALWGARITYHRDRLGRVWACVLWAGLLLWVSYPLLGALQLAREKDEIYYWVRFTTGAMAGVGAWDVLGRVASRFSRGLAAHARAAALALLALPFSLPYWWDPVRMDSYFEASLAPIPDYVRIPTDFVRRETHPDSVFAGDPHYCRWIAALGARRGLLLETRNPSDTAQRRQLVRALVVGENPQRIAELGPRWGVTHLVVTPEFLEGPPGVGISLDRLEARSDLELLFLHREQDDFVAIFRLRSEEI